MRAQMRFAYASLIGWLVRLQWQVLGPARRCAFNLVWKSRAPAGSAVGSRSASYIRRGQSTVAYGLGRVQDIGSYPRGHRGRWLSACDIAS